LIPLANHPLFTTVIPSKMFEAMAMGIPILMSIPEGEATALLAECGAGVAVTPEDPKALVDAILQLQGNPQQRAAISAQAISSATRFTRKQQAALMLNILNQVISLPAGARLDDKFVPGRRSATELHESRAAGKSD
jgi:colanic acid biosynthesis glycosyl transferase WcaI